MWKIYDTLINGLPEGLTVSASAAGEHWIAVRSSEGGLGLAMRIDTESIPRALPIDFTGMNLKELARHAKSWNFVDAGFGIAALNAFYNHEKRVRALGIDLPHESRKNEAFDKYRAEVAGKKVAVVGHFPFLEQHLKPVCSLSILERRPQDGDYPDPACEYILGEQDYVFITGSTLVNKTLPRLLSLARNAWTVLAGPTVTLSDALFEAGADDLSGFVVTDPETCLKSVRSGDRMGQFHAGAMINYRAAQKQPTD
ncbi:MAG: DUF364 domain-containing protein [Spirochaetaceae bacterium]|jgi:uncharacterized protein (DUF4213/DUF364 family)|nr:DUF364 domain-containing protein [Spirochaetaceae bacterium]